MRLRKGHALIAVVLLGASCTGGVPVADTAAIRPSAPVVQEEPGVAVFRQVFDRYSKTRFRTVSFLQRSVFADGRIEWWYEAEEIPGKARVDFAPLANRNTSIWRSDVDTGYVFRNGQLANKIPMLAATMWTLMDMYAVPPEQTAAALRKRNFDLSKVHEREWRGRPVIVVGALADDTLSSQVWLDKERLYAVRQIAKAPNGAHLVQEFDKHVFMEGGWIEQEIRIYGPDGKLSLFEEYTNTKVNVQLPPDFFKGDQYRAPHWVETMK